MIGKLVSSVSHERARAAMFDSTEASWQGSREIMLGGMKLCLFGVALTEG